MQPGLQSPKQSHTCMQRRLCLPVEKQLCFTIRVILLLSTASLCAEHSAADSTDHERQVVSITCTYPDHCHNYTVETWQKPHWQQQMQTKLTRHILNMGQQTWGKQAWGQQTWGQRTWGQQTWGQQTWGQQTWGQQA